MMRRLAVLMVLTGLLVASGCRTGGSKGGWDAYVSRLYAETQAALDLTKQGTEASLNQAIQIYTVSIAKADRLIQRAGTDAYALSRLRQFKATAYLGRGIAHWALAESGVVAGGTPRSSIDGMIRDATASIDVAGQVAMTGDVKVVRGTSYSLRGRGRVLDTVARDFANLNTTARQIIADGNGTIGDRPRQWDGHAIKAWGYLVTGNPKGLDFAARAVELEPNMPAEVLTVTLATLVNEVSKSGGGASSGDGTGSSRRLRSIPNPGEMAAARQAVRDAVAATTSGPTLDSAIGELEKQFPAE